MVIKQHFALRTKKSETNVLSGFISELFRLLQWGLISPFFEFAYFAIVVIFVFLFLFCFPEVQRIDSLLVNKSLRRIICMRF